MILFIIWLGSPIYDEVPTDWIPPPEEIVYIQEMEDELPIDQRRDSLR